MVRDFELEPLHKAAYRNEVFPFKALAEIAGKGPNTKKRSHNRFVDAFLQAEHNENGIRCLELKSTDASHGTDVYSVEVGGAMIGAAVVHNFIHVYRADGKFRTKERELGRHTVISAWTNGSLDEIRDVYAHMNQRYVQGHGVVVEPVKSSEGLHDRLRELFGAPLGPVPMGVGDADRFARQSLVYNWPKNDLT